MHVSDDDYGKEWRWFVIYDLMKSDIDDIKMDKFIWYILSQIDPLLQYSIRKLWVYCY